MTQDWHERVPRDAHWLIVGGTRRGKSGLLQLIIRTFLRMLVEGLTVLDPHGALVRATIEWLANPAHGQQVRRIHVLDAASDHMFGLNPLRVDDPRSWAQCHDAANALAAVIESRFEATPEQTPRLSRIIYVGGMLCARHGLTVVELLEVLSMGGEQLRQALLSDFDNTVVRNELEDLHELARRQPARFLETVESAKNRLVRWLGDKRLARILGQKRGLDPRAVMDNRDIVLFDGSSLSYADAAFIGTILSSMYFTAARYRPPLRSAMHRLIIDEAESLLTVDTARLCDQTAKMGLTLLASIQRLGQLRARGDFIADALLVNAGVKVVFGGLEPESARYMAEALYAGYFNLSEWKPGSERPTAIGQHKEIVRSASVAAHAATHASVGVTRSRAVGVTHSHMHATTNGSSEGYTEASSDAFASGSSTTNAVGSGASSFDGAAFSQALDPDTLNALFTAPVVIGAGMAESAGSGRTETASRSTGASSARISGSSSARSRATMTAETDAYGEARSEVEGVAVSHARGTSRGTSRSSGAAETFVTTYRDLPTSLYTLEEQISRAAGKIANLPRRSCIIKIEDGAPIETRTADLTPAFRSSYFQRLMVPRFLTSVAKRSRYMLSASEADAAIAQRRADLNASPEPDFSPEPMPIVDDPDAFAARFWSKRGKPTLRIVKDDGDSER